MSTPDFDATSPPFAGLQARADALAAQAEDMSSRISESLKELITATFVEGVRAGIERSAVAADEIATDIAAYSPGLAQLFTQLRDSLRLSALSVSDPVSAEDSP